MENINPEITKGVLFCARATFEELDLTKSINGYPKSNLLETIIMFVDHFTQSNPDKRISKIELFLKESDMHENKKPWQVSHFTR
jgi:hypothetical protein